MDSTTSDVNKQERMSRRYDFRIFRILSAEAEGYEAIVKTKVYSLVPEIPNIVIGVAIETVEVTEIIF